MTHNFPPHVKGDTYVGCTFTVTVNGVPLDLTGYVIEMALKTAKTNPNPEYKFSNQVVSGVKNGLIEITSIPGRFSIPPQIIDVKAGNYYYDIELVSPLGIVKTYVEGQWTILQDVTNANG